MTTRMCTSLQGPRSLTRFDRGIDVMTFPTSKRSWVRCLHVSAIFSLLKH